MELWAWLTTCRHRRCLRVCNRFRYPLPSTVGDGCRAEASTPAGYQTTRGCGGVLAERVDGGVRVDKVP